MRKRDKLYEVNPWNKGLFSEASADRPQNTGVFGRKYDVGGFAGLSPVEGVGFGEPNFAAPQIDGGTVNMSNIGGIQGMNFSSGKPKSTLFGKIGGNIKNGLQSGALNGVASAVGKGVGSAIGNGMNSVAGDVLGVVGDIGSALPGPLGAAVGFGANILGGVADAFFGTKVDAAKKAANDAGTATLNNQTFNAGDFDNVGDIAAVGAVQDAHKGGLFRQGWEDEMNAKDRADRAIAQNNAERRRELNIENIANDQMRNNLRSWIGALGGYLPSGEPSGTSASIKADGGFLLGEPSTMPGVFGDTGMGAIDYGFLSDYLTEKRRQNDLKSKISSGNVFVGKPQSTLFALGGDVQAGGGDFSTGLMHIDEGLSHEENPNGGVQLGVDGEGVPNLVEEGEVVFDDYVYSNRILCDADTKKRFHIGKNRDITYADLAKKLEKEINERPEDPISQAGFQAQMHQLADEQERQKQEMEAARAREAFEALSDEEKVAVMQEMAAREEAAMQAEAANMQPTQPTSVDGRQVSPEEAAMMQQEIMAQQGGQPIAGQPAADAMGTVAQAGGAPMMAEGGKVNRFDRGGQAYTRMLNSLGFHTQGEFEKWAKDNNIDFGDTWKTTPGVLDTDILGTLWDNENFKKALQKRDPALAHAFTNSYDWGMFAPSASNKATIQSISRGNWKATNGKGWKDSDDLAFKQAVQGLSDEEIDALSTEQLADLMRQTEAYKNTSKWLENSDNALLYMNTLLNDPDTPEVAKQYARKFIQDGKWKDDFNYDYATVFGSNGKGVRETDPGTYWHSVMEANRGNQTGNFVINTDGSIEPIVRDVPTDWTRAGNYTWADTNNDYAYNYYRRPGAGDETGTPANAGATAAGNNGNPAGDSVAGNAGGVGVAGNGENGNGVGDVEPDLRPSWWRYAGLLGPAVGLGMQALGVGRPDTSGIDAAVSVANGAPVFANYQPIGDYFRHRPLDVLAERNRANADALAAQRNLMNVSGGNRGNAMAGILANTYKSQLANGELFRQATESENNQSRQDAEFNRGTNMFNAQAYNQNQQFNTEIANRNRQAAAQMQMQAAAQKMDADAGWYNGLYGNVAGLFKGISDLGRENAEHNTVARMAANGLFGNMTPDTLIASGYLKKKKNTTSKGGKLNKKKGLTY